MRCLSVRLSRSWIMSKRINISSPSGSHTILVFPYQTEWRYSDGNPHNWVVECRWPRWGRQKTRFWTNIWLHCIQCCQPYESRSVKKLSRDERRQASSTYRIVRRPLFAQDDDDVFVTGSTLYTEGEGRSTPLPVITPVFCWCRTWTS